MRRRSYILIEVIISMMLFAVLLSALFGIFSHFSRVHNTLSNQIKRHEDNVTAQLILQRAFSNTTLSKASRPYFYIEETGSLVFTIDNISSFEDEFTHDVLAKLHIENNNLMLTFWEHPRIPPKNPPDHLRKITVLQNVSSLQCKLFKAPAAKKNDKNELIAAPEGVWTGHWPLEYNTQPTLIHITCDTHQFYFLIPKRVESAIYKRV